MSVGGGPCFDGDPLDTYVQHVTPRGVPVLHDPKDPRRTIIPVDLEEYVQWLGGGFLKGGP